MGSLDMFGFGAIAILAGMVLFILISTWILMFSASLAGIHDVTFGKALIANFAGAILSAIASALLTPLPVVGNIAGAVGGFLVTAWIIREMFNTTLMRACIALVVSWVVSIVLLILLAVLLAMIGIF